MRRGVDDTVILSRVEVIAQAANGDHPASDGAHRLGWWLAGQISIDTAIKSLCVSIGVAPAWVERVLTGGIEPGGEVPRLIAEHTNGAVLVDDWQRGGPLGWLEPPFAREAA